VRFSHAPESVDESHAGWVRVCLRKCAPISDKPMVSPGRGGSIHE